MEAFAAMVPHPAAYAVAFVLGALFGSFANVCIYRWPPTDEHPRGRSVVTPGSHCGSCATPIAWYDNVPLLSYLWLRGKCRHCSAEFSPRYLFVEAFTALLFVALYHLGMVLAFGGSDAQGIEQAALRTLIYWAFAFVMVVIIFIDLDHLLILNKVTYPSVVLFYAFSLLLPENSWQDGLIGAAVGFFLIWGIANGWALIAGREGMGGGDAKLLAVVGALLGWKAPIFSIFVGAFVGLLLNVPMLISEMSRRAARTDDATDAESPEGGAETLDVPTESGESEAIEEGIGKLEVPFGPGLAIAALIYLFLDETIEFQFQFMFAGLW